MWLVGGPSSRLILRCRSHAADSLTTSEVLAELRARHGQQFGYTMGGRWAISVLTERRFRAFIAEKLSLDRPPPPTRNPVIYGSEPRKRR
jgi:hypothetical protein